MALPPMFPEPIANALKTVLDGPARKFSAAFAVLAERMIEGRSKSVEERIVDYVAGSAAAGDRKAAAVVQLQAWLSDPTADRQRRLMSEATKNIPAARLVFPALQIAGPIFRESEFEPEDTAIWIMWRELLSRACDSERVSEAHPAYPRIIEQLSSDEAKLLTALAPLHPAPPGPQGRIPALSTVDIGFAYPANLHFYLGHLGSLGLMILPMGWAPAQHSVMIDHVLTYMLNDFGRAFVKAVSSDPEAAG